MEKLFTLLELQRMALEASHRDSLLHVMVNETRRLIPYTRAGFFDITVLGPRIKKISGGMDVEEHSVYAQELNATAAILLKQEHSSGSVIRSPQDDKKPPLVALVLKNEEEGLLGLLLLTGEKEYNEAEQRILDELAIAYSAALSLWTLRHKHGVVNFSFIKNKKKFRLIFFVLFMIFLFFPVQEKIIAPAEIVARKAEVVTAPFDGMIGNIHVDPGDTVSPQNILIEMEKESLAARMELARQEMEAGEAALARLRRKSLSDPSKKFQMADIEQQISLKKIDFDYTQTLLSKSEIKAERKGVVIFSGASDLEGRSVRGGDVLMRIADPQDYELLIRVPAQAMMNVTQDWDVTYYLNIKPFFSKRANIESVGYEAGPDPDGLLTYKITASLSEKDLKIGWRGTASLKGGWTVLGYAILRRPLIALRGMGIV